MSRFRSFLASVLALALVAAPTWALSNAGVYTLAAVQITTAVTASAQTAIADLDGVTAASIECSFAYGSGGTTASATVPFERGKSGCDHEGLWSGWPGGAVIPL